MTKNMRDRFLLNQRDMFNYALADSQQRFDEWKVFNDMVAAAPRKWFTMYDSGTTTWYDAAIILTPGIAIVVYITGTGTSGLYKATNWDFIEAEEIPFETSILTSVNNWLVRLYSEDGKWKYTFNHAPYSYDNELFVNATSGTLTTLREIWDKVTAFKDIVKDKYAPHPDNDPVITSLLDIRDEAARQADLAEQAANAVEEETVDTWAELPGFYTGYISNLGVLVPDAYTIDRQLSNELRNDNFIVLRKEMNPGEQEQSTWAQALSFVPGVSIVANAYRSGIKLKKILYPRIRMFGRQEKPLPTWAQYLAFAKETGYYNGYPRQAWQAPRQLDKDYLPYETWLGLMVTVKDHNLVKKDYLPI